MTNEELLENLMNGTLDESGQEMLQSRRMESADFDADVSEFERVLELLHEDDAGETASPALLSSTKSKVVTAIATGVTGGAMMSSSTTTFLSKTGLMIVGGLGAVATGIYVFFGGSEPVAEKPTDKLQSETAIERHVDPVVIETPDNKPSEQAQSQPEVSSTEPIRTTTPVQPVQESISRDSEAEIIADDTDPLLKARYAAEQQRLSNYVAAGQSDKVVETYNTLIQLAKDLNKEVESELWLQRKRDFEGHTESTPPNNE